MQADSTVDIIENKGKQPFVCPTDPAELDQCEACQ